MPIYEYECDSCGHQFSRLVRDHRRADDVACEGCDESTHRLVSNFAAVFNEDSAVWTTDEAISEVESPKPPPPPMLGRKELQEAAKIRAEAQSE